MMNNWIPNVEPIIGALHVSTLSNNASANEGALVAGRHHVMTAITQMIQWNLTVDQIKLCLQTANIPHSLKILEVANYIVPISISYLASKQIKLLHISKAANFIQENLGSLCVITTTVSTVALLALGHTVLATTTLTYLTIGYLDRHNFLPESAHKALVIADFIIGNITGLYFGGNFIRLFCTVNLVCKVAEKYFKSSSVSQEILATQKDEKDKNQEAENGEKISLRELTTLGLGYCQQNIKIDHIHKKVQPKLDPSITLDVLIDLADKIDWSNHESLIEGALEDDERWQESGSLGKLTKVEFFKQNLMCFLEKIKNRNILQGKPHSYDILEKYCLYITKVLKEDNQLQALILISLGIQGGEYCGAGIFEIVESTYVNLCCQSKALSLEERIFISLQQERIRVWQQIYYYFWTKNPLFQFLGRLINPLAIHNVNQFKNLTNAGDNYGIPNEGALNDDIAIIDPVNYSLNAQFRHITNEAFWKGKTFPQSYIKIEKPKEHAWRLWKWFQYHSDPVEITSYNSKAIVYHLMDTIGSSVIPKKEIYQWWSQWIDRQTQLSQDERNRMHQDLANNNKIDGECLEYPDETEISKQELYDFCQSWRSRQKFSANEINEFNKMLEQLENSKEINGRVNKKIAEDMFQKMGIKNDRRGKIKEKFIEAMLIEMGVFDK